MFRRPPRALAGFTLIELGAVVAIIAILVALTFPVLATIRARAERIKCVANLKNLAVAAEGYLQQYEHWPQIPVGTSSDDPAVYAEQWIEALEPFGVTRQIWICPTIQNGLHNPDFSTPETARIDYVATPFDEKPVSPHEWPRQPWFVETGDVHGSGNLIIFTDGSVSDLKSVITAAGAK